MILLFLVMIKALDLGRGANPKGYMVEEIWQEFAKAKYKEWERSSSQRSWELQNLKYVFSDCQIYYLSIFIDDQLSPLYLLLTIQFFFQPHLNYFYVGLVNILCYNVKYYYCNMYLCLREACKSALKEKHFLGSEMEGFVDDATTSHLKQLEAVERVFNKAADDDIPTEVCMCLVFLDYRFEKQVRLFIIHPNWLVEFTGP